MSNAGNGTWENLNFPGRTCPQTHLEALTFSLPIFLHKGLESLIFCWRYKAQRVANLPDLFAKEAPLPHQPTPLQHMYPLFEKKFNI